MPCEKTPQKPTPGLSGTQWSKGLFCEPSQHDEPPIPGLSPSSQHDEPPIPGLSLSSQPPEDIATCEPEPEVAPTQSMEEPFARPATPHLIIIIDNTPVGSPTPPPSIPTPVPSLELPPVAAKNPTASSPWCQVPLIPTMTLSRNLLTCAQH
ncbi:hypothetical protein O181_119327 [Austropuccinia psidii MF-1]|uniref:Uncharacterized protein n=1 Tax=Austropuccinia psidii MF-1 TaxID=1389203 RepID=A0A9Q3KEV7_9BASI|nr:hypothetical protein [Austropuccinia psidii MF-1]